MQNPQDCRHAEWAVYDSDSDDKSPASHANRLRCKSCMEITTCNHPASHEVARIDESSGNKFVTIVCSVCGQELKNWRDLPGPNFRFKHHGWIKCPHASMAIYDQIAGELVCNDCGMIIACQHRKSHVLTKRDPDSHFFYNIEICADCGRRLRVERI